MVECYSHAVPGVSVPGDNPEVGFLLRVVEVDDGNKKSGADTKDELVVQVALLDECTTGKSIIKEHCDGLKSLGYETVSAKGKRKEYLEVLREGSLLYSKSPCGWDQVPGRWRRRG